MSDQSNLAEAQAEVAAAEAHLAEVEAAEAPAPVTPEQSAPVKVATRSPWNTYAADDGTVIDFAGVNVSATLAGTLVSGAPGVLRIVQD